KNNDSVVLNIRYKGKDLSLRIDNLWNGWDVYLEKGFNKQPSTLVRWERAQTLQIGDTKKAVDNHVNSMSSNVQSMEAFGEGEKVQIAKTALDDFNTAIKAHTDAVSPQANYTLSADQLLEAMFRVYSFEELKKMNCIKKVKSDPKAYLITDLPPIFKQPGKSQEALDLIYSVKYGGHIGNEKYKDWTSKASEKARESADVSVKYSKRLKKIFAYGLTDFDSEGQKATMADTKMADDKSESKMFDDTKDEYFKKVSGKAAYEDFYSIVKTRNEKGEEVIDTAKANTRLNELYKYGLQRLNLLAKKNPVYMDLQKQVTEDVKTKQLSLDQNLTDLEMKIVRLGYLSYAEGKENDQGVVLERVKTQIIENILQLIPEETTGPNGEKVSKEKARITLKEIPVGVLLSISATYDEKTGDMKMGGGINIPIILDVFNSPYAKLVLVPGITSNGLQFGVGMAFTSGDKVLDGGIVFYGGVSVGLGMSYTPGALFFAGISGGIDFRVKKAGPDSNFNYYFGVYGGVGVAVGLDPLETATKAIDAGIKVIGWQVDAQKMYENEYYKKLEEEGLKSLVDELSQIYKDGSKPEAINAFVDKIKNNKALAEKLDIKSTDSVEVVLQNFEIYLAQFTEEFNEHFNLPAVIAGEIKISVISGAIMAAGLASGSLPVLLGGIVSWGIQILASLKFNVGSKMVHEKHQKTSEVEMKAFGDIEKQKQFDEAFSSLPKTGEAAKIYKSGKLSLDAAGEKRASMDVSSGSAEVSSENFAQKLDKINASLVEKGVDLKLVKAADGRIEIVFLETKTASNEKLMISKDIAVTEGNRIYLKSPTALKFLYFDRQTRKYPLEISHGATMETVITVSDNRYLKGDTFPAEIEINRFADNKENPVFIKKVEGKAESYVDTSAQFQDALEGQKRMKKALEAKADIDKEPVREKLKDIAKKIYAFANKKGETFVTITNKKAKGNKETPDYVSTELYAFYDEYATSKKIDSFNSREKQILTLELSTLRYTELQYGKTSANEKSQAYKERMKWNKETLIPFFQKRIDELKAAGKEIKHTATELADKATQDLMSMDTNMPPTQLEKGTSVAIAIGRGANGLHQILDGGKYSVEADADQYGYIIGKDYTEALKTATPGDLDYEIGLILVGQLSYLPERAKVKEFMDSNLAKKLASNGGLAFILGKEQYGQVIDYYEKGTGDGSVAGIAKFMDIVEKIRQAQKDGKEIITVDGEKNVKFQIKVNTKVQSGIFSKCANYTSTINEEISIIPPSESEAMVLLASGSEARTTLTTKTYKQFLGFFGGVSASVAVMEAPTPPEGNKPKKPDAPAEGEVVQKPNGPNTDPTDPGTPNAPAPAETDIKNKP
ncbi:hypothetical protein IT411_00170, partial [Candidatus Peregrinibacteria bacterium]|nr:hypothetical protein [Candidatus Peregrinibacteria bacterium]